MIDPELHDAYEVAPCGYITEYDQFGKRVMRFVRITTPELINWEDEFDGVVWTVYVHLKNDPATGRHGGVEDICDCPSDDIAVMVAEALQVAHPLEMGITYIE